MKSPSKSTPEQLLELIIYIDGASRGNPGPAGMGMIIYGPRRKKISQISQYLGNATNNVAEYEALIIALKEAQRLKARKVRIYTDSQLLARQFLGEYRVKDEKLKTLFQQARAEARKIDELTVTYTEREKTREADRLANQAINLGESGLESGLRKESD